MKKLSLLLAALLLLSAFPMPAVAARAEITIMLYICGADLTDGAESDISELVNSNIPADGSVNVILTTGGASKWSRWFGISSTSNQFHQVTEDGLETLESIGDRNMGEADTLSEFLQYGYSQFPADRYVLILWNHGGGPLDGVCVDYKHGHDALMLAEVEQALKDGVPEGEKLDMLCFDACLMNSLEVFTVIEPYADYAVASQELVPGSGMNYDKWMEYVLGNPDASMEEIGVSLADTFVADNPWGKAEDTVTLTLVDLARIPDVVNAAEDFGAALSEMLGTSFSTISRARDGVPSFGEYSYNSATDLVDIGIVCDAFAAILPDETRALQDAADEAVVYCVSNSDIDYMSNGISIYMPYDTAESMRDIREAFAALDEMPEYGEFVLTMAESINNGSYTFTGSQPTSLYSYSESGGATGLLADVWGQLGDTPSLAGGIWTGVLGGGAVGRTNPLTGIWGQLGGAIAAGPMDMSGIWVGLDEPSSDIPTETVDSILQGILSGVLQTGGDYYSAADEDGEGQTPGLTEGESTAAVLAEAQEFFAATGQEVHAVYSMQLTMDELGHLSSASGVLLEEREDGTAVVLGSTGVTTVDWETGMIYSLFNRNWVTVNGTVVPMDAIVQNNGTVRVMIPVRVQRDPMYLVVVFFPGNDTGKVLGLAKTYDQESGTVTRGYMPVEEGMGLSPLYDRIDLKTGEVVEQILGYPIFVPDGGLTITRTSLSGDRYLFSMELHDIYDDEHLMEASPVQFD